ncbi:uncharacterized protein K460DRAFT_356744 [Cucurbitaria berberidis CBS 394.84]|uniref:BTB domain-containing protein n=1 Tax=Cucurbitaria berberidis CBS 394.84 TaxID=1168544 RepID=A0A9P4GBS9_9PLEO|nr:uncharacterized protein K460DRAFT_356744 [Cucurbitaria berberidis CBS 394.84]KAF1842953.1 hypothetical protein K460DRAFT_356744 [Cucurbitaria berberidis CBS 394.84]
MTNTHFSRQPTSCGPAPKDSSRVRVQNTIRVINNLRGGEDIANYSLSARKELASSDTVDIVLGAAADKIEGVPKLALLVLSTTFRQYIEEKPEAAEIKVVSASIHLPSVAILMNWVKDVASSKTHYIIKVPVPATLVDKVKLIHAAHILGMSRYIDIVIKRFKEEVRSQIPRPEDCAEFEQYAISADHEIIKAVGERFGYLLRTYKFPGDRKMLTNFLARHEIFDKAVRDADARSLAKRATQV